VSPLHLNTARKIMSRFTSAATVPGSTAAPDCRVRRARRTLFRPPMFPAGALETTREGACAPPVVHPKLIRPNKKRPPYPKAAWRFLQFDLRMRGRGRWSRRSSRSCGCAGGRKGVQTELVADAGVGGIADGPLQVGGVLNGQQPFV
jgi:hypothetical protein